MAKLNKRVWNNSLLSERTKVLVYQACVLSTLLYGSESWTACARQEKPPNSFHLRCLRRLLKIKWQDRVLNTEVLDRAGLLSMPALLSHRRLRWLGHVHRMDLHRLPRETLYGELRDGARRVGRPQLRFKDVCKRDMKGAQINADTWEALAKDRDTWHHKVKEGVHSAEQTARNQVASKGAARKERTASASTPSTFVCPACNKDCHSRIPFHRARPSPFETRMPLLNEKNYLYPDITIILIVFLQYRYIGDSFKTIPRYNDVILPVPWYIVISGFYCN